MRERGKRGRGRVTYVGRRAFRNAKSSAAPTRTTPTAGSHVRRNNRRGEQGSCVTSCVNIHYSGLRIVRAGAKRATAGRLDHYFPSRSVEYQRRRRRRRAQDMTMTTTMRPVRENDAGKKATRPGCHRTSSDFRRDASGRAGSSMSSTKLSASATFAGAYHRVAFLEIAPSSLHVRIVQKCVHA